MIQTQPVPQRNTTGTPEASETLGKSPGVPVITLCVYKLKLNSPYLKTVLEEFDTLIRSKNFATKGKGTYQSCVKEFLCWMQAQGINRIQKIDSSTMIDYYQYISTRPNQRKEGTLSESMINQHLFSLRMLFEYLLETEQISSTVLLPKNNQGTKKERNIISLKELTQLYKHCRTKKEKAILSIAYGCGLRRTEIHLLNTNDINLTAGILIVRKGKLLKRREIPISDKIIKDLKDYLVNERANYLKESNRLEFSFFVNERGKRMTGDHLNKIVREIILRTKDQVLIQKQITLHCLRHSIATHLIDNGADIEFVQKFLGHSEINTSHIYARRRKRNINLFNLP